MFLLCLRRIPGALLHSPPPHRHPLVLPGAGGGPADQAWQHRGVELCLPTAGRHWGFQSDGECRYNLVNKTLIHTCGFTAHHGYIRWCTRFHQHLMFKSHLTVMYMSVLRCSNKNKQNKSFKKSIAQYFNVRDRCTIIQSN